ncbi:helix-turn-helix transcriptional regulator [Paenibacillus sp. HJGM_3]|uniref:helix-turn-helix transcriptional regulator n=1 Tax=Paenibacillus sp. HJGM_3 TaxID=3379816 RepID=UPI0038596B88
MTDTSSRNFISRLGSRGRASSLFFRLLVSFLIIISLLVSFILFSVMFYRDSIKDELIKYNTLNLKNTTDNYETVFALIQNAVLSFSLKPELQEVSGASIDYVKAVSMMQDIQTVISNRLLHLNNLMLLYKDTGFVLEKSRGADLETMFNRYYTSPDYSAAFWTDQFGAGSKSRMLPASTFGELDRGNRTGVSTMIPIVVKNDQIKDFYLLALADADEMYASLHHSINDNFYIMNGRQRLFASAGSAQVDLPEFSSDGYLKREGHYFFSMKGKSGYTYIQMIPDTTISSQVRWNFSFLLLLIMTVSLSVGASFLLSHRLQTPVKRIVEAIQKWNTPTAWESSIKEFNLIHARVSDILKTSQDMRQHISEKESLLRHYAYSNRLKNIRAKGQDDDTTQEERPFVLLLFQVNYKSGLQQLDVEQDRATAFIREFVNRIVMDTYPDSHTFQMEADQILSIVFAEPDDPSIAGVMSQIKQVLDTEREYCFLTMTAVRGTQDWNEAYRHGERLLERRRWNDKTQQIEETDLADEEEIRFSTAQEEELDANLNSGNEAVVLPLVKRLIGQLRKKDASAGHVMSFAHYVLHRLQKTLQHKQLEAGFVQQAIAQLPSRFTYDQLEALLEQAIHSACQAVKAKKDKRDPIIHFVYDYLEAHYERDITLDAIAERLNISRSYLSTYFKEKTGTYFVDYVNSVRIRKAKQLLQKPDIRIQDAAALVGYQNINSFNRMFKKFTGVTPSEFRKHELL